MNDACQERKKTMIDDNLTKSIKTEQLARFLDLPYSRNTKKQEYVELLSAAIKNNPSLQKEYYATFKKELALPPWALEQILNCSKNERIRWGREKKLHILFYKNVRKYGTDIKVPYYDRYQAEFEITPATISLWRNEHDTSVKKSKKAGIIAAKQTRSKNNKIRQQFKLSYETMLTEWKNTEYPEIIELAYWTMWKNRWAKTNKLKARTANKNAQRYIEKSNKYYNDKEKALMLLTSYSSISFYEPKRPDKIKVHFCQKHYNEISDSMYYGQMHTTDMFLQNPKKYLSCPDCITEWHKNYYSLYYIVIEHKNYRFSFHVPYIEGSKYLPHEDALPHVHQEEQEGMFRFGRGVNENEMITHSETFVNKMFSKALNSMQEFVKKQKS